MAVSEAWMVVGGESMRFVDDEDEEVSFALIERKGKLFWFIRSACPFGVHSEGFYQNQISSSPLNRQAVENSVPWRKI